MTGSWAAGFPDLAGRTVIVTGASSGVGQTAAAAFAGAGARVVLAVRDQARGDAAAAAIGGRAEVRLLDLARLDSVSAFAAAWHGPIDLLINNAGVMIPPLSRTADGFELQFGTNHLGHFALTGLLLPSIAGRVVTVSSSAHRVGRIDFDDLNWERRRYRRWPAYGQSKLANLLFTTELQRRLAEAGSPVLATAAHPGYAATRLGLAGNPGARGFALYLGSRYLAQDAVSGALPTLYAALADIPGDSFAGPGGLGGTRGEPVLVRRSAASRDPGVARRLWTASEQLTGVPFPPLPLPTRTTRQFSHPVHEDLSDRGDFACHTHAKSPRSWPCLRPRWITARSGRGPPPAGLRPTPENAVTARRRTLGRRRPSRPTTPGAAHEHRGTHRA